MSEIPQLDFGLSVPKSKDMPHSASTLERFILAILGSQRVILYIQSIIRHEIAVHERQKREREKY